jgi:hypothetical protein
MQGSDGIARTPQEALERFVIDNDELRTLEASLGAFNIFDALGIASRELQRAQIWHCAKP